ncbi:prephenate dehydrogenase [Candidatus Margulisiibacteriota bacterium]
MNKNVCIVGLGLIGGSIGMAIKSKRLATVFGLTRKMPKIGLALEKNAVDFGTTDIKKAIERADIIFICYPIHLVIPELKKILKFVKKGAIITDVGSTKEEIVKQAEKIMPKGVYFVGGHPMAGKEKVGLEIAERDLFKAKVWVLTRGSKTNHNALNELKDIIAQLGASVSVLAPDVHDKAVAGISHSLIPIAAALVNAVHDSDDLKKIMTDLASSGFKSTTRVASGDPTLAVDMFATNKKAVLHNLREFKKALNRIESAIKRNSSSLVKKELMKAKKLRDSIFK